MNAIVDETTSPTVPAATPTESERDKKLRKSRALAAAKAEELRAVLLNKYRGPSAAWKSVEVNGLIVSAVVPNATEAEVMERTFAALELGEVQTFVTNGVDGKPRSYRVVGRVY